MNASCSTLAEENQDPNSPLPKMLYAQLHGTPVGGGTGSTIGVMLSGSGSYSGDYAFTQCDAPDTYYIDSLVLVSSTGNLVATATSLGHGSNAYNVVYPGGEMITANGFTSTSIAYMGPSTMPTVKVLSITPSGTMARQGDYLSVQVSLSDGTCGIRDSQWWLTAQGTNPGTIPTANITKLPGGSGTASVRVDPKLAAGTYYVEGLVTLNSGRVFLIRRNNVSDPSYKLYEGTNNTTLAGDVGASAMAITVSENATADHTPPIAWGTSALPAGVDRCGQVNLSLSLTDDKGLPSSQMVKMFLGPASNPKLTSVVLSGSDVLSGAFVVPSDAPYGVWFGYPDSVTDAAGNVTHGTPSGGTFVLSDGTTVGQPVMSATFIVSNPAKLVPPDLAVPSVDGGVVLPDLSGPALPATLATLSVSAAMPPTMPGNTITVQMTWNDNAKIL